MATYIDVCLFCSLRTVHTCHVWNIYSIVSCFKSYAFILLFTVITPSIVTWDLFNIYMLCLFCSLVCNTPLFCSTIFHCLMPKSMSIYTFACCIKSIFFMHMKERIAIESMCCHCHTL